VIELSQIETTTPTQFLGYDALQTDARVLEVVSLKKSGNTWLHVLAASAAGDLPAPGTRIHLAVDRERRAAIQRHHTVTHLLHWALHEVVSADASQKGSFVGPDKLTFDFNSQALSPSQIQDIERLVNERILENAPVSWTEVPFSEVKGRPEIMQFFGEKYGDTVRVVQIGGARNALDGYSMELCAGTHARATGEIGLFRILSESAIAAGVRRIEAVTGMSAYSVAHAESERLRLLASKLGTPLGELEKRLDSLLIQQRDLEKTVESLRKKQAAQAAAQLVSTAREINGIPFVAAELPSCSGDDLQAAAELLKGQFRGVAVLATASGGQVSLAATVHPDFGSKVAAGKIIQAIAPIVGGKGGGRPDLARGAGKDPSKIGDALAHAATLL
jgi:alanyl-tRNA synthetase